jgi:cyanophycinase-like exopeptidase
MDERQNRKGCAVGEEQCGVCEKDDTGIEVMEAQQATFIEEEKAN